MDPAWFKSASPSPLGTYGQTRFEDVDAKACVGECCNTGQGGRADIRFPSDKGHNRPWLAEAGLRKGKSGAFVSLLLSFD